MNSIITEPKVKGYDLRYKIYNDSLRTVEATRYSRPIYTKEAVDEKPKKTKKEKRANDQCRTDNLNRSKNALLDYIKENESIWLSFITLTFSENVTDVDTAMKELNKYTSKVRRVFPGFAYCGTIEAQKRGAWHFHMVSNIMTGTELMPKREPKKIWNPDTKKWYIMDYYDIPYWVKGYSSVFDLAQQTDDNFKVHLYIAKYIAKGQNELLNGRKKVLKSNNLKKPRIYKVSENSVIGKALERLVRERKQLVKKKHILEPNKYEPSQNKNPFTNK